MLKSVRDLSLQPLSMNTEMNPLSGDGSVGQPVNNLPGEPTLQSNEFNPQVNEQTPPGDLNQVPPPPPEGLEPSFQGGELNQQVNEQTSPGDLNQAPSFQDSPPPPEGLEPSFQGGELNQQVNEQTPPGDLNQMPSFQDTPPPPEGLEPSFQDNQLPTESVVTSSQDNLSPSEDTEPAFQIDEQMPSVNPIPAQNNDDQLQQFDVSENQSKSEIPALPEKKTENILVELTPAEEEEFHKEQEDLFQQMSKNFALGKDQDAIQMREQLKQNVGEEYSRLSALLKYIPPKLPKLQENIRDEMKGLEKSLEDNNREGFSDISKKLWSLRDEMQEISKMVAEKRKTTEEKIEDFKKRYGNLVPGPSA